MNEQDSVDVTKYGKLECQITDLRRRLGYTAPKGQRIMDQKLPLDLGVHVDSMGSIWSWSRDYEPQDSATRGQHEFLLNIILTTLEHILYDTGECERAHPRFSEELVPFSVFP